MTWRRFALIVLGLFLGLSSSVLAKQPDAWFSFDRAIADFTWVMERDEHRDEVQGTFSLRAPDEFSFSYQTSGLSMRRIRGYRNFTITQFQGQTSFGYNGFPLFRIWQEFFWPLTQVHLEPLVYVASERVAHRDVDRYYLASDPQQVYWIDQQTNVPLLIMEGQDARLSVTNYRFDSGAANQPRFLELELDNPRYTGKLTLWWGDFQEWVPVEMVIEEGTTRNVITFSNWEIGSDQVGDLGVLKTLEWEISLGQTAHNVGQWEDVLSSFRKVLAIDPYYLPAYFFLGHTYYTLGNYLGTVENYQQALMLQPDNALALNNLAYTYMERQVNLVEAVRMAERAVDLERRATYLDTLGFGYYLLGQYDQAKAILEEALSMSDELDPQNLAELELHLEMVYHALEKAGESSLDE